MTRNATERLELLYDLGCRFAECIELDELIEVVVERCRETLGAEGASVLLLDEEAGELYFPYVSSERPEVAGELARMRLPADQGIAGMVMSGGEAMHVADASTDERIFREVDERTGRTTRSLLAAPLKRRQETIGVLQVTNHRDGPFPAEDLPFLETLAGSVAVAIENARLYAATKESAERLKVEVGVLRRDLARGDNFPEIVGTSPAMTEVFRLMESAAAAPVTVLIEGETGTGKELVARALHNASPRADGPFIAVNCAAVPENLLESELFGHRKGAFTGAHQDRIGVFEAARSGTIFLDEIGEMPLLMQVKLLRVLQESEIVPLGDHRPKKIDVRVLSATNRDLLTEVDLNNFREDLYYRIATFPIYVPPLRGRGDDVLSIATSLLTRIARRHEKTISGFDDAALQSLREYSWPGNVRELQNELERATALVADGELITSAHLTPGAKRARTRAASDAPAPEASAAPPPTDVLLGDELPDTLREARATFEKKFLTRALERCDGNATRAAGMIGLSRAAIQNKIREYKLR